eukprot:TRINITY_DN1290_c0_g1_i1.p1 TRINITY_DN1290_c0_g1~~TRINITY_DN1290_c0_g1_i1.p1  ORF type:complete len:118 (-),score=10.06 TRINITY_DN1290_c0_g1_i1:15-368(-)
MCADVTFLTTADITSTIRAKCQRVDGSKVSLDAAKHLTEHLQAWKISSCRFSETSFLDNSMGASPMVRWYEYLQLSGSKLRRTIMSRDASSHGRTMWKKRASNLPCLLWVVVTSRAS